MQQFLAQRFEGLSGAQADERVRDLLAQVAVSDLSSENKRIQRAEIKQWYRDTYGDRDFFVCSPMHRERIQARHARAARRAA